MNRRAFLLGAAALAAGCAGGKDDPRIGTATRALQRRSVGIDYASYYAPIEDVRRLVNARAAELEAAVTFSDDPAGTAAQNANLRRWTGPRGGFTALAVAPFDVAAIDPIVARAKDVAVVAYISEFEHQAAAITVDRAAASRMLAERAKPHADGGVLLIKPLSKPPVPDPFAPGFAEAERAIRAVIDVRGEVEAQSEADGEAATAAALQADPSLAAILCWNDTTAVGAAKAAGDRWVGGLGAPSLTSTASLDALGKTLRCLVAARLSNLSDALVEVPLAYARGETPGSRAVAMRVITPGSSERSAFAADFGR